MKWIWILTVPALVLSACAPAAAASSTPAASQPVNAVIAEGRLEPANTLDLNFSVPGQVAEVLVHEGDRISADQLLARLASTPEIELALARANQEALSASQALDALNTSAQLNLALARQALLSATDQVDSAQTRLDASKTDANQAALDVASARLKQAEDAFQKLNSAGGVDPDQKLAAEARLSTAKAAVTSAQSAITGVELHAPWAGRVAAVGVQPFERIPAGQPVVTLVDDATWLVRTDNLTEAEVVRVKVGQAVAITFDALPGVILDGVVAHINSRYELKRGDITYTVTAELNQADPNLRWGMTAAVQFVP